MSKFTYKQLESFYVELNAVQYHYGLTLNALQGLTYDSSIEPDVEGAMYHLAELELAAKSAADQLRKLTAWAARVEVLIEQRKLSPAAREATYDDVFFQHQESNALTWEQAYLELNGHKPNS